MDIRPRRPFALLIALAAALSLGSTAIAVQPGAPAATKAPAATGAVAADTAGVEPAAFSMSLTPFRTGLSQPIFATNAGDGTGRVYVVEKTGRIKVLSSSGSYLGTLLNISDRTSRGGEQGLLGLAFHPDYAHHHRYYVDYTDRHGDTVIVEYRTSANGLTTTSGRRLIVIGQPYDNHNGGMLAFGADGYLYIAMGDGGSGGDPGNRAQRSDTLLGKLLRMDVDHHPSYRPYGIPPTNPYVNQAGLDLIFAKGLRNPWRFSFDRETDALWIGDVGQERYEEIDRRANTDAGPGPGANYGWHQWEGRHCYSPVVGLQRQRQDDAARGVPAQLGRERQLHGHRRLRLSRLGVPGDGRQLRLRRPVLAADLGDRFGRRGSGQPDGRGHGARDAGVVRRDRVGRAVPGDHRRGRVSRRRQLTAAQRGGAPNRAGSSAARIVAGTASGRPSTSPATCAPEAAPVESPHGPWPAATNRRSTPGTGPTSGRPSSASGLAHARRPIVGASAIAGTYARATRAQARLVGARIRLERQERRPERRAAGRRGQAEVDGLGTRPRAVGIDGVVDPGRLEDGVRWPGQVDLHDRAPRRADGTPCAGGIDDLGCPRPGRDDDRARSDLVAVDRDPLHGPAGGAQRGHRTLDHVRAAGMRERCERPRRGPRSDREADVEADRGQPRRQ